MSTPNVAVWNLADLYLQGMKLTYVGTTSFTVSQGQARDSTNVNDIVLALPPQNDGTPITTAFTCSIAANGVNGLDTGTIAADKQYYVFAIASSQNSQINLPPSALESLSVPPFTTPSASSPVAQDGYFVQPGVLISLSATAPLLPYGYDMFRRIGAIATNGSSQVVPFDQRGSGKDRTMTYRASLATDITAGSSATFAAVALTNLVPAIDAIGIFKVTFTPTGADDPVALRSGDSATDEGQSVMSGSAAGVVKIGMMYCPYSATVASGIDYKVTGASTAINVQGYIDQL